MTDSDPAAGSTRHRRRDRPAGRGRGKRGRAWLPRMLAESALIVLSILLALAVDQWRETREREALARQALAVFAREIRHNREQLEALLPYHTRLEASFARLDSAGTVRSMTDWQAGVPEWSGFRPALLQGTAWQTALAAGALAHLDYETVSALSRVYAMQQRLDALFLGQSFTLSDGQAGEFVRQAMAYLQDATTHEQMLLREYDAAERLLRNQAGGTRAAAP